MSEFEPSAAPEITQEQGDRIVSFVLVDMADELKKEGQYTFDRAQYPELQLYNDVTVRINPDESIHFVLHYEKSHESFFDTYSYYAPDEYHRKPRLELREKYTLETWR